jgi:thioredoxin reductase (NADPH)
MYGAQESTTSISGPARRAGAPVLLAVDGDAGALARIERELTRRYGQDYRVVCAGSSPEALNVLREMRSEGADVAIVLADQWMPELDGCGLLAKVRELHPHAKRALLIEWGAWADRPTADAIRRGMARAQFDYYVIKPTAGADEQFHRILAEFLHEWSRTTSPAAYGITLVGGRWSPRLQELRNLLVRNGVPHAFEPSDAPSGKRLLSDAGVRDSAAPVAILLDGEVLVDPTNAELAAGFGVDTELDGRRDFDLVVVGAGPAGLTAAVYASSEGLRTLVVEREAIGGQAGSSSLIRNYLGFSRGVSGSELAQRAYQQAWVFGTQFLLMREATALRSTDDGLALTITGAGEVTSNAMILASGVSYRRIAVDALEEMSGAGVYYGASLSEAQALAGDDVYVVGGGNSAAQAAMQLSRYARRVTLVARRTTLAETMSRYLRDALEAAENIDVRLGTEIVDARGDGAGWLEWLVLRECASGEVEEVHAGGLFILIGGLPHTDWLPPSIERDSGGYLLTGSDLVRDGRVVGSWPLERAPLMLETSLPAVFAVGDARHGSVQRVSAGVGEGSVAVAQLHQLLDSSEAKAGRPGH